METKTQHLFGNCGICNKELTQDEQRNIKPHHYTYCCKEHSEYAGVMLIEIIQKRLGIIKEYSENMTHCGICKCKLTPDEIKTIEDYENISGRPVCTKHIDVINWQQYDLAVYYYFYLKVNPNFNINNKEQAVEFYKSFSENYNNKDYDPEKLK